MLVAAPALALNLAGTLGPGLALLAPALTAFLFGAVGALLPISSRARAAITSVGALLGAAAAGVAGLVALSAGGPLDGRLDAPLPFLSLVVHLYALAGVSLLLLALVGGAIALYLPGFFASEPDANVARLGFFLNALAASLVVVFTAAQAVAFLVAWETMSLAGFFLVAHHDSRPAARAAASTYFVMAHLGTAFLFVAFAALFAVTGSFEFAAYRGLAGLGGAAAPLVSVALVAAFAGFALKAGLVPFHGWLPDAYSEAPAPASAMMSGIMSKAAVFVFARFALVFLGAGPAWWGALVFTVGLASALLGVLYATQETDLKRVLAYSSIENLGIVFAALGLAMVFAAEGEASLALLAAIAALFHAVNHGALKTLLFLAAGNVERAAGTRDLARLGGLARRMPWTAALFLGGVFALAALPPGNAFASEWLLLRALASGFARGATPVDVALGAAGVSVLALVGGLVVLAFVRAQGTTFHGIARSREAAAARESDLARIAPLALLAGACVALSLAAPFVFDAIAVALGPVAPGAVATVGSSGTIFAAALGAGAYGPWAVAALVAFFALVFLLVFRPRRAPARTSPVWACGNVVANPRATYSALATGDIVRALFSGFLLPRRSVA
ncbi:MAG: proton-conducting transporter transmembrane domain-containing protein, partial [Thermoplasmatota archaeon]